MLCIRLYRDVKLLFISKAPIFVLLIVITADTSCICVPLMHFVVMLSPCWPSFRERTPVLISYTLTVLLSLSFYVPVSHPFFVHQLYKYLICKIYFLVYFIVKILLLHYYEVGSV